MRTLIATLLLSPALVWALTPAEQADIDAYVSNLKAEMAQQAAYAKKNCPGGDAAAMPAIGMSEAVMLNCTTLAMNGGLELVNTTEVPGAVTRQYQGKYGLLKFVYTRNGVVTGIQK